MKKVLATMFITAVALVLAGYSAMRSLDFIQLTLPADQAATGYLALIATEGGIFCWLLYFLFGAEGAWQRGIGLVMTLIDLVGSVALFVADTLYRSAERGLTTAMTPEEIRTVIFALSGLIALNVGATVACHLFDPAARKKGAEQEAFSELENATLEAISKDAKTLAATLAPVVAADWINTTRTRYTAALGSGVIPSASQVIDARVREDATPPKTTGATLAGDPVDLHEAEQEHPAPTEAQPPTVDPAMLAAIMAAMAAMPPAQPSPIVTDINANKRSSIMAQLGVDEQTAANILRKHGALIADMFDKNGNAARDLTDSEKRQARSFLGLTAYEPAQPAPNGNGHNKPDKVTYQAESEGLPPLAHAPTVENE